MAAKWTRPRGVIIVPDYCLPGVFWDIRDSLERNPGWSELSGAMAAFDPGDSFNSIRPSVPGTGFLILLAPGQVSIGPRSECF
ncbi:MAG: hypothetical protein EXQ91_06055 [Alphaproteobacteria bacterium]|nr:hypothetical protein [Alphaproteobacteria bacterium]